MNKVERGSPKKGYDEICLSIAILPTTGTFGSRCVCTLYANNNLVIAKMLKNWNLFWKHIWLSIVLVLEVLPRNDFYGILERKKQTGDYIQGIVHLFIHDCFVFFLMRSTRVSPWKNFLCKYNNWSYLIPIFFWNSLTTFAIIKLLLCI